MKDPLHSIYRTKYILVCSVSCSVVCTLECTHKYSYSNFLSIRQKSKVFMSAGLAESKASEHLEFAICMVQISFASHILICILLELLWVSFWWMPKHTKTHPQWFLQLFRGYASTHCRSLRRHTDDDQSNCGPTSSS